MVFKGRRRIEKNRLALEFSKTFPKSYFLTGILPGKAVTAEHQKQEFARQLKRQKIPITDLSDWGNLFSDLAEQCKTGRLLVVLDEITWMGDKDPIFLPKLKTIWDTHFKQNPNLILIVSGSNSSWIDENLLSSTGFVGRVSYRLKMNELPLHCCSEFWGKYQHKISPYEKFKILSVTGGIPRYLEEIRPNLSAEQNLLKLCYHPSGVLFSEFDQIFSDLFSTRSALYKSILEQCIKGNFTQTELTTQLHREKGGDLSHYLAQLVESDFLSKDPGWNIKQEREERLSRYRVSDNYIRFYLKHIEPHRSRIVKGTINEPPKGWKSIMGLQFENLVCNNVLSLLSYLKLNPNEVIWYGPYKQQPTSIKKGCQVDLLIQTKYNVLYLCEVKLSENELPVSLIQEVQERSSKIALPRGFSMRHVLIHVNGVSENIEYEDFFSNIINFGQLLED